MQTESLINHLREKIQKDLSPLVSSDYVYLDLPYHPNIGDTLIWGGTREFLKTLPYKAYTMPVRIVSGIDSYRRM